MPENLTILITGASRGIGKGLAAAYLAAPGNTVIASVRDPVHPNLQALRNLPCGPRSSLVIAQIDSGNERSIQDAIQNLHAPRLDVVISNAGVNESFDRLVDTTTSILDKHIHVNAYGPLWLFQQTLPLLSKSSAPRFVVVSSGAGSTSILDQMEEQPMGAYGASKSLVNHLIKRLSVEVKDVIIWLVNPGCVETDMVKNVREHMQIPESITIEESVAGIMKMIGEATQETSGQFLDYDGANMPW
ncbi:hypothetical protein BGZ61DRAFT_500732 [Ilyonectria robusta]|uniref:uncharacterized protein n=1 Tax=Ilyonectria robusta TaxID=1079257 RepID=UPI001E8ED886|nr:uncharacterized protein BGZ61DRAFT_500732 [Ilyonectria robusta]KAH8652983.1 hypothetical protein BGZ61DRAFT_500732 [Ilyonectria robusta]